MDKIFFRSLKAAFLVSAVFFVFAGPTAQNTLQSPDKDKGAFSDRKDSGADKNWENSMFRKARTSRERKFDRNSDGYLDSVELKEYHDRYDRR